ncbi:hypothetical protein N7539_006949 [Penicillium diatomitis]|uniref:Uncharacterized protein n=1 Tax=Penicillium diatomitis TaxID=2819901 RepID=A0A9X0BSE9_9EURO|nr:uncharacterized protein N7539_006949 [Penicillium diatomitis]KAJ5481055.1 hypothetical protein N7539_006949 [Penicillium diatomitis]
MVSSIAWKNECAVPDTPTAPGTNDLVLADMALPLDILQFSMDVAAEVWFYCSDPDPTIAKLGLVATKT